MSAVENCKQKTSWGTRRCLSKKKKLLLIQKYDPQSLMKHTHTHTHTHPGTEKGSDDRTKMFTKSIYNY
jgi:hypothetical protein